MDTFGDRLKHEREEQGLSILALAASRPDSKEVRDDPEGECAQVCGGFVGALCPEGEICDLAPGECQTTDLQGVCVERPETCPEIYEPVCDCDGQTYSTDCFRLMAGAQKDHAGECSSFTRPSMAVSKSASSAIAGTSSNRRARIRLPATE